MPLLDPSIIANGVKPPSIEDPMMAMQKALQVQQLRQQQALAPLKTQELQGQVNQTELENQAKQRDIEEQKAFGKAMVDSGGDPDKFEEMAAKTITSPTILSKVESTAAQIRQRQANVTAKQHETAAKSAVGYASGLQSVIDSKDPDTRLGLWSTLVQKASAEKDADGNPMFPNGIGLNPNAVPNEETLKNLQTYVDRAGTFHASRAKLLDEQDKEAKAADERKKAAREQLLGMHAEAATAFQGVDNKEDYDARVADFAAQDDEHKSYAQRFLKILPYSDKAISIINSRAMTAEQRVTADQKTQKDADAAMSAAQRAAVAGGKAGLAARATDPTASAADRKAANDALLLLEQSNGRETANARGVEDRYNRTEQNKDSTAHDAAQLKEKDLWDLRSKYGDAIAKAEAAGLDTIKDPKNGKDISLQDAKTNADDAKEKAMLFQRQARSLRAKHGWGEFGEMPDESGKVPAGSGQPAAPVRGGQAPSAPGMVTPGNIDLNNRPVIKNSDGTTSTVRTMTIEEDGKTILIPTAVNGKIVSDDDAIKNYHKTGQHMGIFSSEQAAEDYDKQLHNKMGWNGAPGSAQAKWQATAKPSQADNQIDPTVKKLGNYEVGKEYETKDGRKIKIKGFTKNGKAIPE